MDNLYLQQQRELQARVAINTAQYLESSCKLERNRRTESEKSCEKERELCLLLQARRRRAASKKSCNRSKSRAARKRELLLAVASKKSCNRSDMKAGSMHVTVAMECGAFGNATISTQACSLRQSKLHEQVGNY